MEPMTSQPVTVRLRSNGRSTELHADTLLVVDQGPSGTARPVLLGASTPGGSPRLVVRPFPVGDSPESVSRWGRDVGAAVVSHLGSCRTVSLDLLGNVVEETLLVRAIAGVLRGLRGDGASTHPTLDLLHPNAALADRASARAAADDSAGRITQQLVDARGNQCPPRVLVEQAMRIAAAAGFAVRVHERADLVREGMGGLLAVAAGSAEDPFLVELWRDADGTAAGDPPTGAVALVGKGVTFDSGGLSLKPADAMVGMHTDKAGAATVLGAISSLANQPTAHAVHAVLPLAENMPGAGATRPGDVVTTLSGIGIEIVDTDFEGRVMLADALAWASRSRPRAILDLATLTYQAVVALGPDIGALIARDVAWGRAVEAAADRAGEPLWYLPWAPRYRDQLISKAPGATLRNHPGAPTGRALTAALFLGEFVPPHIPWAHLDFAGPAVVGNGADQTSTGYGTGLLRELLIGGSDVC